MALKPALKEKLSSESWMSQIINDISHLQKSWWKMDVSLRVKQEEQDPAWLKVKETEG